MAPGIKIEDHGLVHCLICCQPTETISTHLARMCMQSNTPEERQEELQRATESSQVWARSGRTWDYADICRCCPHPPSRDALLKELTRRGFLVLNAPTDGHLEAAEEPPTSAPTSAPTSPTHAEGFQDDGPRASTPTSDTSELSSWELDESGHLISSQFHLDDEESSASSWSSISEQEEDSLWWTSPGPRSRKRKSRTGSMLGSYMQHKRKLFEKQQDDAMENFFRIQQEQESRWLKVQLEMEQSNNQMLQKLMETLATMLPPYLLPLATQWTPTTSTIPSHNPPSPQEAPAHPEPMEKPPNMADSPVYPPESIAPDTSFHPVNKHVVGN